MSLKNLYEQFLASPNPLSISDTATFHYVTTLTSFSQPGSIIKHLETQNKNVVKKKNEKIISAVEGQSSIALEVETTLEFISNGGAYLPGLDNFVVDHIATIPITHFVHFDRQSKISQIRLTWDQGSLLRQVEVIGARGKNWPVYDGKEQIKIITRSSNSAAAVAPNTPPRGRNDEARQVERSFSPTKRHIKDPHASLDLFEPKKSDENGRSSKSNTVAPRESAKPPPREYTELFAAGHEELQPSPGGSPQKVIRENVVPPKGAGNRKFEHSNLFGDDQTYQPEKKIYKTNPARYNHFDIGDHDEADPMQHRTGSEAHSAKHVPLVARSDKGGSQWNFEDFATPAKVNQKVRDQDTVHFSFENGPSEQSEHTIPTKGGITAKGRKDAEAHFELQDGGSSDNHSVPQPKPRKDANTHFDFSDAPTPAPRRIIARTKAAAGLYANNQIYDEEAEGEPEPAPLGNITNNASRKNNDAHWNSYDQSPEGTTRKAPLSGNQRKGLETHWSTGDEGTEATKAGRANGRQQEKSFWDF